MANIDSLQRHKLALEIKHRNMDNLITEITKSLTWDETQVKELKTEKLALKHEIAKIETQLEEQNS